jgi:hypothetical protein
MTKLFNILLGFSMLLSSACKEEKPTINPCMNGVLDAGETAIDCGGSCGSCPNAEYPSMFAQFNGISQQVIDKSLVHENDEWLLSGSIHQDTLQFQLNFGSNGAVGLYPLTAVHTTCTYQGNSYTFAGGFGAISAHNLTSHKLSGHFQAKFGRNLDTIRIMNGDFEFLSY